MFSHLLLIAVVSSLVRQSELLLEIGFSLLGAHLVEHFEKLVAIFDRQGRAVGQLVDDALSSGFVGDRAGIRGLLVLHPLLPLRPRLGLALFKYVGSDLFLLIGYLVWLLLAQGQQVCAPQLGLPCSHDLLIWLKFFLESVLPLKTYSSDFRFASCWLAHA